MQQKTSASIVCLLTDFGTRDGYVGVMKGVILHIAPATQFVDLTHDIPPQDLASASWVLRTSYRYFAPNTIFLCVVDPGVGSQRLPLAMRVGSWFFVGPDNGLFSALLAEQPVHEAVTLTNPAYHLSTVSNTFQGRDIFSPVAAHIAHGTPLSALGHPIAPAQLQRLAGQASLSMTITDECVEGNVAHIDHFGNIITNIIAPVIPAAAPLKDVDTLSSQLRAAFYLLFPQRQLAITRGRRFFAQQSSPSADETSPFFYTDSSGYLAVAIQNGNASSQLHISRGERVICAWSSDEEKSV